MAATASVGGREARFSFPIVRKEYTPEGDLVVYGPCTDGTRDSDHQKVDPRWSAKALEGWISTGGNMRVQHSPFLYPAGKGLALETFKDGSDSHWLKALVLRSTPAFDLVEKGVLRDFSIGVLDPVTLYNDPTAPAGTIAGGEIGEVSLVDRGSNKNTTFTIVKAAKGGPAQLVAQMGYVGTPGELARMIGKRQLKDGRVVDSSGADRSGTPDEDFAGPNKTFPIDSRGDVSDAASLAHHADNPAAVRAQIRSIASRKFGMKDEEMPPSLKEAKTCSTCHGSGTILQGNRKCPDCSGPVNKGDAGEDYPGDRETDTEEPADYADDQKGDGDQDPPESKGKAVDPKKLRKKLIKAQREALKAAFPDADNGGDTPVSDPKAEGKTMEPAGKHREPDGNDSEQFEKDAGMTVNKSIDVGFGLRRLHDLVCPAFSAKAVRKAYGLGRDVFDGTLPERELQTLAMKAIGESDFDLAGHYAAILEALGSVRALGPDLLLEARKAFPEMFPNVHPRQQSEIRPSQFTRGYLSDGHPAPTASGSSGRSSLPEAPVHHVSASQFQRGFISSGHSSMSPSGGTQASASTAAFGQALNSLASLHRRVAGLEPSMCPVNLTHQDFAHSDEGKTGIRPAHLSPAPARSVGEAGSTLVKVAGAGAGADATATEERLRKKLAKAQVRARELAAENHRLGSLPSLDPSDAPFRGIPELDGPVDRKSLVGKAVGGGADDVQTDQEYLDYLQGMASSGDPKIRASAMKVLQAAITK